MVPWAVLITGAVGVGGTALGAWLNGRMQTNNLRLSLDAENKRARVAEKRAIYAHYNSASSRLWLVGTSSEDRKTEPGRSNHAHAVQDYFDSAGEVALIAPNNIRSLMTEITQDFVHLRAIRSPEFRTKREALSRAMRADLGEPE